MYDVNLSKNIGSIVQRDFVSMDEDTLVGEAAKIMQEKDISCILVTRKGSKEPIGIVTERDVLYRVVAKNMGPYKVTLSKIMSYPLVTIDEESSVADALSLMRSKHIRRLPVIKKKKISSSGDENSVITGIVTLMSAAGNIPSNNIELAEVEVPRDVIEKENIQIVCPYCQSRFENKLEMSKHIDRIHIGSGLLEGDVRQW